MLTGGKAKTRGTGGVITADLGKEMPRKAPGCWRGDPCGLGQRAAARQLHDDHRVPPCRR